VVLSVPGITADPVSSLSGLPLAHVFSGADSSGLTIRGQFTRTLSEARGYNHPASAPEIVLGPHAIIGTTLDIAEFFPSMNVAGLYRIVWQPYGGLITSNQITIDVSPLKQAIIMTDEGSMTVEFMYNLAPRHVANFIELARSDFYNQRTFHRIEPGFFIQGGCPKGDGTGIRLDGKRLKAEFSGYSVDRGTLCMARIESDPDSASCQFVIANTRLPEWDGHYTVFGQLVGDESFTTLDHLMSREVDPRTGRPKRSVYIRAVRIVDAPTAVEAPTSPTDEAEAPAEGAQ
jgi:peptidyl-prolyl cis-trans isomerase B (cyclophilin B)